MVEPTQTDDKSGPLNFLRPKDTARAQKARGRRPFVNFLRVGLPVAAGLVLLWLVVWPMVHPDRILTKALKNVPDIMIENLNYTDVDSKQQPYSVSAAKATRPSGTANAFDLQQPQAEITLTGGVWVAAKSQYGRYDRDTNHLWLGGEVQIFHDKGIQFTSDELQADLNGRKAWGDKPVLIQGDFGEIRGIGFQLMDSGKIIVVKGPAKALLNLQGDKGSVKPAKVK